MSQAARSHVGANAVTTATKWRDFLIIVIGPFVVPGVALGLSRGFALGDVAFGFVAVAIAGVARAVTVKTDEWQAFTAAATPVIVVQTALAVTVDSVEQVQRLLTLIASFGDGGVPQESVIKLRQFAGDVVDANPAWWQWLTCIATGVVIMALSAELIRRER